MKKLMIAFAAVAVAACAQAAQVNWQYTWATDKDGKDLSAGTATYLVNVSAYTIAAAKAALSEGDFDFSKAYLSTTTKYSADDGAFVSFKSDDDPALTGSQSFYTLIIKAGAEGAYDYMLTDAKNATMKSTGATTFNWDALSEESGESKFAWSTYTPEPTDTPEPTSAMLMLLGVAGLALRRKQK